LVTSCLSVHAHLTDMGREADYTYEADTTEPLSTEVVTAVAKAHDEDVIEQKWHMSDDINTDALNGLFQDHNVNTTLQFNTDTVTVTIIADIDGDPIIHIDSHR